MNHLEDIKELLIRHFRQELNSDDAACLMKWLSQSEKNRLFFDELNDIGELMANVRIYEEIKQIDLNEAWKKMKELKWNCASKPEENQTGGWIKIWVAASVVLCVFVGIHVYRQINRQCEFPVVINRRVLFNTVTVPAGSDVVYLQLSDGSKVWLNAESSICYPVLFTNDERIVEITGEAYFEVPNSDKVRFTVNRGNMSFIVQGTKFNVNACENEDKIKVTLLEGSVKIKLEKEERTIKPGQQAILSNSDIDVVNDVDMCEVVAWKEGKYLY